MILTGEQHWVCPNCDLQERTQNQDNRFHPCPGLAGLLSPMVLDGVRCRVRAVVREDYVNGEDVRYDGEGRPMTSVLTEYGDGRTDCVVFAPAARVRRG